jgi:hypothetical protein
VSVLPRSKIKICFYIIHTPNHITYIIDIIKGFISLSLTEKIFEIMRNRENTKSIIYKYRQKFVSSVNFFWKKHCNLTKELDKRLGIVKKSLKEHKGVETYNVAQIESNIPKYEGLVGIRTIYILGVNHWVLRYTWILLT